MLYLGKRFVPPKRFGNVAKHMAASTSASVVSDAHPWYFFCLDYRYIARTRSSTVSLHDIDVEKKFIKTSFCEISFPPSNIFFRTSAHACVFLSDIPQG